MCTYSRLVLFIVIIYILKFSVVHCNNPTNLVRSSIIMQGSPSGSRNQQQHRPRFGPFHQRQVFKSSLYGSRDAKSNDHAIINGEFYETNRVFLQKSLPMGIGYFAYGFPKTPIFVRSQSELNRKYVVFQDPYLPPGEGYLVVLKKIPHKAIFPSLKSFSASAQSLMSDIPYEAFHLLLGNNIQGSIDRLNVERLAYDIRTNFYTQQRARTRWIGRRQQAHLYGRRFMMGGQGGVMGMKQFAGSGFGWRGKRNVYNDSSIPVKGSITTSCTLLPLNVTQVRQKLRETEKLTGSRLSSSHSVTNNIDSKPIDDFQYFM